MLYPEAVQRPRSRVECAAAVRPCPYVGCRYHLYVDVSIGGGVKFNFPDLEPWELTLSCALDIADAADVAQSGLALETIGRIVNLTRERVRQIEDDALSRANARLRELLGDPDWFDEFQGNRTGDSEQSGGS